jgi:type I restriction enzyme S subunit
MAAPITTPGQRLVPTSWREIAIKRRFSVTLGKMLQPEQRNAVETEEQYIRSANVQWAGVDTSDIKTMWFSPEEKRALRLCAGDLVVNEGGDVGRCAPWKGEIDECYFQNSVNRVRAIHHASTRLLYYWLLNLKSNGLIDAVVGRTTIAHLTAEKLESLPWADIPKLEQERLATYLDASCAAVDGAVTAKRRQIDTQHALLGSIVTHAATQGIDSGVSMKPSGLDWLPEVPGHWSIEQVKRRCDLLRGKFSHRPRNDPAFYGGEYPFVQTGDITGADKYIRSYSQTLNELGHSVSRMFPRGTLVMSIAANVGDVAILDFEACFPDSMVGLVPNRHTNLDYLYYLMRAMKGILLRSAVLTTQLNLNYVRIGTNFAPFPPKREQAAIAAFLNQKASEVSAVVEVLLRQIDTLLAYRKSLIHECVTGQRRVTEEDLKRMQAHA